MTTSPDEQGAEEFLAEQRIFVSDSEPSFPMRGDLWVSQKDGTTWAWGSREDGDSDQWFDINTKKPRPGQLSFPGEGDNEYVEKITLVCPIMSEEDSVGEIMDTLITNLGREILASNALRVGPFEHRLFPIPGTDRLSVQTFTAIRPLPKNVHLLHWNGEG